MKKITFAFMAALVLMTGCSGKSDSSDSGEISETEISDVSESSAAPIELPVIAVN